MKTTDAGATWSPFIYASSFFYKNFHFINEQVGFLIADNTIVKTVDGGSNFYQVLTDNTKGF